MPVTMNANSENVAPVKSTPHLVLSSLEEERRLMCDAVIPCAKSGPDEIKRQRFVFFVNFVLEFRNLRKAL